jgi:hypothetical protein
MSLARHSLADEDVGVPGRAVACTGPFALLLPTYRNTGLPKHRFHCFGCTKRATGVIGLKDESF